jgi:predicted TIM-barrel fold metal-dependent hydrolase
MSAPIDYSLFDADNHYYETRDAFSGHIDPAYRDKAIRARIDDDGVERVYVGDRRFTFLEHRNFDTVVPPGALRKMLRSLKAGTADIRGTDVEEPMQRAYTHRDARLSVMDAQGIESIFLFPTLAVCVEAFMMDDPGQLYANCRSFNSWLDEQWGFNYQGRIFAPPLMSLRDVDQAVAELEWALARGTRAICLRAGPAYGRSPADAHFDPFWARVNEAKLTVGFHIGESSYNKLFSTQWGEEATPASHRQSAFQWTCFYGDRPIMDTVAALIYHNLFGRFPDVRVMSIENGSLWVPYLMRAMDKMNGMGRNGPWPGGRITEKPSEIFKRHVFVSPYHEEPIQQLVELIGPSQVLFGSDFPHAEGLADPQSFADSLPDLSYDDLRRVMRENARTLVAG